MVYHLKYLDSQTSCSLWSYGSEQTRIGVSPFDTTCWMLQMRMRSFKVSGPFERQWIWRELESEGTKAVVKVQNKTTKSQCLTIGSGFITSPCL